jgi:hypothetical protein
VQVYRYYRYEKSWRWKGIENSELLEYRIEFGRNARGAYHNNFSGGAWSVGFWDV